MVEQTRVWIDVDLLEAVRKMYPETEGMTWTGLTDYILRQALKKEAS